ncbi:hypothetical protein ACWEWX_48995, partial [Streptomyces asiaticus]
MNLKALPTEADLSALVREDPEVPQPASRPSPAAAATESMPRRVGGGVPEPPLLSPCRRASCPSDAPSVVGFPDVL